MKRLIVTKLDSVTLPEYIKHPAHMAVKSACIKVNWFNLPRAIQLRVRQINNHDKVIYYSISRGFWKIDDFLHFITKMAAKDVFTITIDKKTGVSTFKVMKADYEIIATDSSFWELLGIDVDDKTWLKSGENYKGKVNFYNVNKLRLYCKNIDDTSNCVDGKKSKLMHIFPLNATYQLGYLIEFYYENPVYIPLKSSTDTIEFELRDSSDNTIRIDDMYIEFLLK